MMRFLSKIKEQALKLNDFLKKMEQMPIRGLRGELEEEEDSTPIKRAPRKNNVKVEDLRPQRPPEDSHK